MTALLSHLLMIASLVAGSPADHDVGFDDTKIKVLLFCNQPNYVPGDTVYFSAHVFQRNYETSGRQLLRIGLWDSGNVEITSMRLWLNEGYGLDKLILPATMKPGVHNLVAYFEHGLSQKSMVPYTTDFVVSSETSWTMPPRGGNVDSLKTKLTVSGDTLGTRQKIRTQLTNMPLDDGADPIYAVAIYNEELFYRDRSVMHILEAADNVVLIDTTGQFVSRKYPSFFSGVVKNLQTGQPSPDSSRITFFLGKDDLVYSVYTGRNGQFGFPLFKHFEQQDIFYTISYKGKIIDDYEIRLASPVLRGSSLEFSKTEVPDPLYSYSMTKRSVEGSYQFFLNRNNRRQTEIEKISIDADIVVRMDKFDPFASMEQLIGNVVPMVRVRKSGGKTGFRIFLKEGAEYAENEPLYIIDGVMTRNTEYLIGLDPTIIERVLVLRTAEKLARFGDLGKYGILVVETKLGQAFDKNPPRTLTIGGVSKGLLNKPAANQQLTIPDEFPDMRPLLYWYSGPLKQNGPAIEFTTSNVTGSFIIEILRIDNDAVSVSRSRFIVSP